MKTVYRYEIDEAVNKIKIPANGKVLSVGITTESKYVTDDYFHTHLTESEHISIWVLIDTNDTLKERTFLVFGTGANMDATETYELTYIGDVKKSNKYVFHIFEVED